MLLLALAISDLLQNNKSGIGPSKEHSNNAIGSNVKLSRPVAAILDFRSAQK
jgi:hypothetical protein